MKLDDIPKHNIYQVPEGYFDRLPTQVMTRTAAQEKQRNTAFGFAWKPVRLVLAPLLLLLIFVSVFFLNGRQEPLVSNQQAYNRLDDKEILEYLSSSYAQLEPSDFNDLQVTEPELTADFMNVSPEVAEEELEYYQLNNLTY